MLKMAFIIFILVLIGIMFYQLEKAIKPFFSIIKKVLIFTIYGVIAISIFGFFIYLTPILMPPIFEAIKVFILSMIVNINDISTSADYNNSISLSFILLSKFACIIYLVYLIRKSYKWIFTDENINSK